jgi:hypothetical protein
MPFWLESWAGDNAGEVVGREPNMLLISITTEGLGYPLGLFQNSKIGGFRVYPNCYVDCLTPNAGSAAAIDVESRAGNVFAIGLAQLGFGDPEPWDPGVHLFAVSLGREGNESSTIATAVITDEVPHVDLRSEFSGSTMWRFFR